MPALLTVAKYDYPLYPSFSATRRAEKTEIIKWNNSDINATCIGLNGSKTRVIKVFPPLKTARKCQKISDIPELAKLISNIIKNEYPLTSGKKSNTNSGLCTDYKPDPLKVSYKGEVGVIAEHYDSIINPSTFEMIGKARELADTLNSKVNVFIAGNCIKNMTEELIYSGADNIYIIENKLLKDFEVSLYAKVYSNAIKKTNPQIVLLAATPLGRILAPMISYTLKCGLTADCTELSIGDIPGFNLFGVLIQTRPALGGNVMATICTKDSPLQMATARPGIMKRFPPNPLRKGMMIKSDADIKDKDIRLNIIKTETANEKIDFNVELIVSCGKGVKNKKNFDNITQSFCKTISEKFNIRVEKGGSRAAVEHGYIDRIYQIGQTGTAVSPKIYFALGISGAIQHMIAINNAENIIAINKDPDASIFKQCDYYYIGNVEEVIPTLIKYLIKE
ncbi:MAG: hypothetical protein ACD_79C01007G0001 [uncultured bacterium]|nr:MAG: hypothetical protein ACD_79C01007G0001 [uncultured bacterium]